jgi:hypothetical protein
MKTCDRPLPFIVRVAAEWMDWEQAPREDDGVLWFRRQALLTGNVAVTGKDKDIQFSDLDNAG